MSLGKNYINYIKKELRWFLLLIMVVAFAEYLILVKLSFSPIVQFIIQMVIGLFLISTIIRVWYRIWLINEYHHFMQDDDDPSYPKRN